LGVTYDRLDAALLWQTCCSLGKCSEHQHGSGINSKLPIPSWCWIAKGHNVWYEPGHCSIVSRLTWHTPIQYTLDYDKKSTDQDYNQLSQPPAMADPTSSKPERSLFDFTFLHFTAQTSVLHGPALSPWARAHSPWIIYGFDNAFL
jgi:hypothetical protein